MVRRKEIRIKAMHDLSISQAITETVLKEARDKKARKVLSLKLEIGELTFLSPEQIRFWLKELFKGTLAEGAKICIKKIFSLIKCKSCSYEGNITLEDNSLRHTYFPIMKCPKCSSFSLEIKKGKECLIRQIRVISV